MEVSPFKSLSSCLAVMLLKPEILIQPYFTKTQVYVQSIDEGPEALFSKWLFLSRSVTDSHGDAEQSCSVLLPFGEEWRRRLPLAADTLQMVAGRLEGHDASAQTGLLLFGIFGNDNHVCKELCLTWKQYSEVNRTQEH